MNFVFQRETCSTSEKAAVRAGLSLMDGVAPLTLAPSLFELIALPPGTLQVDGRASIAPCPVGTVEFCRAWRHGLSIPEPAPLDYPPCLRAFLGREVRQHADCSGIPVGQWIKPVRTKAWQAQRVAPGAIPPSGGPVWSSEHLTLRGEFRVYVLADRVVGAGRYDDGADDGLAFDASVVDQMIATYRAASEAPAAYALDVAVLADGRTILIEVTDAWAIGYYRGSLAPRNYVRMLWARWREIAGVA